MSEHGDDCGRFTLAGRVGLGVSALAALTFGAVIASLDGIEGRDYLQVVNALAATRRHLMPALALGGCVLLVLAGLLTWLVARWASFRLAGPLYRFARNVRDVREGAGVPMHIRSGDLLQSESRRLMDAIACVQAHEAALREAAEAAAAALRSPSRVDGDTLRGCLADLRALAERARV